MIEFPFIPIWAKTRTIWILFAILSIPWIITGTSIASDPLMESESTDPVTMTFEGSGSGITKTFTVEDGWKITWEAESPSFRLIAHGSARRPYSGPTSERDRVVQWFETVEPIVLVNSLDSKGEAFHPYGGTFYLKILAKGPWSLSLTTVKDTKDYLDVPYTGAP